MSANALSLPVDIPWKRLCVSEDMIDPRVCDRRFPYRWRSSVAMFSYEPGSDFQTYEGMIVAYIKVACTITGFQPDPEEVGIHDRRIASSWSDPEVIDNYLDVINKYYGCYGAILEVAVAPGHDRTGAPIPPSGHDPVIDPDRYPYFADFEPKKRELYETVSETGEVMSRSLEDINVRKGTTTTDTHEKVDVMGGVGVSIPGVGSANVSGQWGTRDISSQEYSNVRTTDQGRENRETFSHTTQLSQMYQQFTGYHLGTNRAVFFMLPRPHIVQSDLTFVNGPRLLEGVQEIFLVVLRPKDMPTFCAEAWLETAHIASEPVTKPVQAAGNVTLHVEKRAEDTGGALGDDSNTTYAEGSETYTPPEGWVVDLDREGGFHIDSVSGDRIEEAKILEIDTDHVTIYGKVSAWFEDRTWPQSNVSHNGVLDMSVTVFIRTKEGEVDHYDQSLWLTGRGICCCAKTPAPATGAAASAAAARPPLAESVTYERPLGAEVTKPVGASSAMTVAEANHLRATIGRELARSVNSPFRYPFGEVRMIDTQLVARAITRVVRRPNHPENVPVVQVSGIPTPILERIKAVAPQVSRGRLLQMPMTELTDRFGLTFEQARTLRAAALGLAPAPPTPDRRWTRPGESRKAARRNRKS